MADCEVSLKDGERRHRPKGRLGHAPRFFAGFAVLAMVLVAFQPLSWEAGAVPIPEPGPPQPSPTSASAPVPGGSTDSPGGTPPSPGTLTSVDEPWEPLASTLPPVIQAPELEVDEVAYRYATVAGRYTFSKDRPFLMTYSSPEGDVLVDASTFAVLPGVSLFRDPQVLAATRYEYRVRYDIAVGPEPVGNVTIIYTFRDADPPKIAAELHHDTALSLSLAWAAFTTDGVVYNGTHATSGGPARPSGWIPRSTASRSDLTCIRMRGGDAR